MQLVVAAIVAEAIGGFEFAANLFLPSFLT